MVVGYQTYIDLVRPWSTTQEVVATGMKAEVKRCQLALDRARAGQKVAIVSSGDAGIYGMAGLVLEMCAVQGLKVGPPEASADVHLYLEVIPGVPALAAGAALLGAPLMHDFVVISLSDLLTPGRLFSGAWNWRPRAILSSCSITPRARNGTGTGRGAGPADEAQNPRNPRGHRLPGHAPEASHHRHHPGGFAVAGGGHANHRGSGQLQNYTYGAYMITPRGYQNKYSGQVSGERQGSGARE